MIKRFCKKCNKPIKARDGVYCAKCALEEYAKRVKKKDRASSPYDFKR
jgi:uncharacterized Zn finger protein (UPF0148 family)